MSDSDSIKTSANEEYLKIYRDCGFLKYEKLNSEYNITLREDGVWFILPPELKVFQKKERIDYCPKGLEEIAKVIGYPVDFYSNLGKYRKLYLSLSQKYNEEIIQKVVKYIQKEDKRMTLNLLLTGKVFEAAKQSMENPKKPLFKDRVESTNYDEEVGF